MPRQTQRTQRAWAAMACLLLGLASPPIMAQSPAPAAQPTCALPSNDEAVARINMGILGDARFRPIDERVGHMQVLREREAVVVLFSAWIAQPAGEWTFVVAACGEIEAYAFAHPAVCPGRTPPTLDDLHATVDAERRLRQAPPVNWSQYDVTRSADNCADVLVFRPKSHVLHGDFVYVVDGWSGQAIASALHSPRPSVNGQIRYVRN